MSPQLVLTVAVQVASCGERLAAEAWRTAAGSPAGCGGVQCEPARLACRPGRWLLGGRREPVGGWLNVGVAPALRRPCWRRRRRCSARTAMATTAPMTDEDDERHDERRAGVGAECSRLSCGLRGTPGVRHGHTLRDVADEPANVPAASRIGARARRRPIAATRRRSTSRAPASGRPRRRVAAARAPHGWEARLDVHLAGHRVEPRCVRSPAPPTCRGGRR